MKTKLLLILAALVLLVSTVSAQIEQELILEKGVAPHVGIDNVYRRFTEAYRKLNAEAVTNLYTDDALYLAPGSNVERGREKILANFSSFFNSVKTGGGGLTISFRIVERGVSEDLAYDVGVYTLAQKRGDQIRSSQGKFVVVARRMKNGDWRFAVDSYNNLPDARQNSVQSSISAKDLENLFDPIFAERMEKLHIPGAVISVVKDGKKGGEIAYMFQDTYMVSEKVGLLP